MGAAPCFILSVRCPPRDDGFDFETIIRQMEEAAPGLKIKYDVEDTKNEYAWHGEAKYKKHKLKVVCDYQGGSEYTGLNEPGELGIGHYVDYGETFDDFAPKWEVLQELRKAFEKWGILGLETYVGAYTI